MTDEALYKEVTQSIKAVFDLTARVDERLKMISERQGSQELRLESITSLQIDLATKVGILESKNGTEWKEALNKAERIIDIIRTGLQNIELRMQLVERATTSTENKWKQIFDFIYKTVWVILVCYLLFKLNLQTPPMP